MVKLVVGLGNPGKSYVSTRHNVGYRVIEVLEAAAPPGVLLFKPSGFMNTAGASVAETARRKGISPFDLLVVCDDFSLPLGTLRFRLKGSSGGHNGLDSILQTFGTQEVPRLRLGIGPVPDDEDPADFVLARFFRREKASVDKMVQQSAEAVRTACADGLATAMNRFNKKTGVADA